MDTSKTCSGMAVREVIFWRIIGGSDCQTTLFSMQTSG